MVNPIPIAQPFTLRTKFVVYDYEADSDSWHLENQDGSPICYITFYNSHVDNYIQFKLRTPSGYQYLSLTDTWITTFSNYVPVTFITMRNLIFESTETQFRFVINDESGVHIKTTDWFPWAEVQYPATSVALRMSGFGNDVDVDEIELLQ